MKLYADILDASDNPIATITDIASASVSRELDGPGRMSFSVPCMAAGADSLTIKRRARLMLEYLGVKRELGTMILDRVSDRDSAGQWTRNCDGSDIMTELKYASTLLGRSYSAQTASAIVSSLVGLASGWSASVETTPGAWQTSIRYDGDTVLRALQILAETGGFHIRRGDSGKTVEFGAFGDETAVIICNPGQFVTGEHDPQNTGFITSITMERIGEPIATRLYPLGAGNSGDAVLTLESSTRVLPTYDYAIQSATVNGRAHHYIENAAAADIYGDIIKVGRFKNIAPLANTVADIEAASNALYDISAAWLNRYSVLQETIRVSVTGLNTAVKPGDKVRLVYKGRIQTEHSGEWVMRDYDDFYWIISVSERFSASGVTTELELSNVDQRDQDEAETVIGAIEELRVQGIRVQPTFAPLPYGPFLRDMDSTHSVTINVPVIDDAVFRLTRATLLLRTTPLRANAKQITSTTHSHLIMRSSDGTAPGAMATRRFTIVEQTTGTLYHFDASADVGASAKFFDTASGGNMSSALTYGLFDDTDYPDHIAVSVNSESVATGLDASGVGLSTSITITDQLQPPIAAALRQTHEIVISCTGGQGTIEVILVLWCQFLPFALS